MRNPGTAAAMLLLLAAAGPASGQVIIGRLLDDATSEAVATGEITLLLDDRASGRSVTTGNDGQFILRAPGGGAYRLRAERLGYQTVVSPVVSLRESDTVHVELRMSTSAVVLTPLTVTASSRGMLRSSRALEGFYDRKRRGWGNFRTPDDLKLRNPWGASDVLMEMPGVYVYRSGTRALVSMRGSFGRCVPSVFVDEVLMKIDSDFTIDDVVPGSAIRAMEVYRWSSAVPMQFQRGGGFGCGAIVIWTNMAIPDPPRAER